MRLPFFYGWIIIAVTFVTMAIGVNARTAFSLFFPPIIDEFGWERGVTAGAFSFGFVVSAFVSPLIGRLMDHLGPRSVMELGVALMAGGLLLLAGLLMFSTGLIGEMMMRTYFESQDRRIYAVREILTRKQRLAGTR